ncbi:transcriptional regulator, IclR family [Alteribacillus persepolensis]|uniref:Transcriptional regulator, IclR family n=1 Tax=Alteribacillus persepolensis TaxID=568899 RepID=A0A1G8FVC9_9BACI|nr:IclR family transcriptional regulator [Alteribacillus persepolensis]SDH86094.1 transcriptional regulator, IclR family [Alteribacillus persepolensis]
MKGKYVIRTVENAMQILRLFTSEKREWTLTEIAKKKEMNIASAQRLVKTLENYKYIERSSESKKYRLGLSILRLSGIVTSTMEIHQEARPIAEALVEQLGEAVHIGVLEGSETVYLEKIESLHPVRLASYTGKQNPGYCTGCGKVVLAYKDVREQERMMHEMSQKGFYPYASNTVTTINQLSEDLKEIKRQGHAVCVNEFSEGITSIAAPIYDHRETVIAAISVTGPHNRINIAESIKEVVKAGERISKNLGYIF